MIISLFGGGGWPHYPFCTPHLPPELLDSPSSWYSHLLVPQQYCAPKRIHVNSNFGKDISIQCGQHLTCNPFSSCLSLNLVSLAPEVNVAGGEEHNLQLDGKLATLSRLFPGFGFQVCPLPQFLLEKPGLEGREVLGGKQVDTS